MTEHSDQHPALDPDRVEQYVLGRLTPPEQQAFDTHLQLCAECRRTVDAEMLLAAGIRRTGRIALKKRLAASVEERPTVPWPRIVAVAAVVIIIAGLGIIRLWINREQTIPPLPTENPPSVTEQRTGTEEAQDRLSGSVQSSPEGPKGTKAEGTSISSREEAKKSKEQLAASKDEALSVADSRKGLAKNEVQAATSAAGAAAVGSAAGLWTEGMVFEAEPSPKAAERPIAAEAKRGDFEIAREKRVLKAATQAQGILLNQKPSRSLTQLQRSQQTAGRQTILTYAEQVGEQLRLTLYPDTLFAPEDLEQAAVKRLDDDSLLIRVGRQSIGYRLPRGFFQQQTRK
jgi:hypothetical protein